MIIPAGSSNVPATFEIKGDHVRWSLPGTGGDSAAYRVYDARARRLFTVLPTQASVTVDSLPDSESAGAGTGRPPWTFTVLDSRGSVAGYPCARLRATDGERTYDLCAAKGFPRIPLDYALPSASVKVPFLVESQARGELPLIVAANDAPDGGIKLRIPLRPMLTTVEVRPGAIDDARFVVPSYPVTQGHLSAPRELQR